MKYLSTLVLCTHAFSSLVRSVQGRLSLFHLFVIFDEAYIIKKKAIFVRTSDISDWTFIFIKLCTHKINVHVWPFSEVNKNEDWCQHNPIVIYQQDKNSKVDLHYIFRSNFPLICNLNGNERTFVYLYFKSIHDSVSKLNTYHFIGQRYMISSDAKKNK